ncbi:MAG: hypothetical protein J0M12_08480 [Deltaproteobacteria bacterium]|nr:hypothetical protein [Deltaproteobacteria bacterium]
MKRKSIKYATREGRVKTTIWLDRRVLNAVTNEADERNVSKQSIMENSLKERYSEAVQVDRDAAIADRLNKLERGQRRLEEQSEISAEAHALFVRMWLASTPEVPIERREEAVHSARTRYERYLIQLSKRVSRKISTPNGSFSESKLELEDFND